MCKNGCKREIHSKKYGVCKRCYNTMSRKGEIKRKQCPSCGNPVNGLTCGYCNKKGRGKVHVDFTSEAFSKLRDLAISNREPICTTVRKIVLSHLERRENEKRILSGDKKE